MSRNPSPPPPRPKPAAKAGPGPAPSVAKPPAKPARPRGGTPPPPPAPSSGPAASGTGREPAFVGGKRDRAQRVVIFGTGGVGKTTLASLMPAPVFLDLESGTDEVEVTRDDPPTFLAVRDTLAHPSIEDFGSIVVDTGTRLQAYCHDHVLETIPHKGEPAKSIEDYGYGKGYRHIFDCFALVLADLDRHAEAGRHVCIICHDEAVKVPNPAGEDWLRWEPRLQNATNANIRKHVTEWAGHVLHLAYDVAVNKGKARGSGTVTVWPRATGTTMAKSRRLRHSMEIVEGDPAMWHHILNPSNK